MNYSFDVFKVFLQTVMYFRVKWIIKKERKGGGNRMEICFYKFLDWTEADLNASLQSIV